MAAPAAAARTSHAPSRTRPRPKPQRRRSGPVTTRKGSATKARTKTRIVPSAMVRSGTVALPRPVAPARRRSGARARPAARGAFVPVLDRLLRGPAYIAVVGILLAGIVFFNVDVLELNNGIAKTGARAETLERENAVLTRELAKLASSERIQQAAAAQGLVLPPPGDIRYLAARGDDSRRALKTMSAPSETLVAQPAPAPVAAAPAPTVTAPATTTMPTTTPPPPTQQPTTTQTQTQTPVQPPPAPSDQLPATNHQHAGGTAPTP